MAAAISSSHAVRMMQSVNCGKNVSKQRNVYSVGRVSNGLDMKSAMGGAKVATGQAHLVAQSGRSLCAKVCAVKDGTVLDRPLRVAVIGGGPSGACAAETLAKGGVETYLIERKMDNCKVRRDVLFLGILAGPGHGLMGRFVLMRVVEDVNTCVSIIIIPLMNIHIVVFAAMRRSYSNLYGGRIRSSNGNY